MDGRSEGVSISCSQDLTVMDVIGTETCGWRAIPGRASGLISRVHGAASMQGGKGDE
jgi:hypothetical protein